MHSSLLAATAVGGISAQTTNCIDPHAGPVLGGIDMVAFETLDDTNPTNIPVFGSNETSSVLNGYTFHFKSDANKAKFDADPWRYAPAWGGFWAYGIAYESVWSKDNLGPGASQYTNAWIGNGNGDGRTFMNRDMGPKSMFESKGITTAIATGEKIWTGMFSGGNSSFVFNTACFHGSAAGDDDEAPTPAPGPAPAGCVAAVHKACPGETGTTCMTCCQAHHATLITSCPQGASEMREACGMGFFNKFFDGHNLNLKQ